MRQKRRCLRCHRLFVVRPQNPNQRYCPDSACQRARKQAWERRKLAEDPDYRQNRKEAQRSWRENNPDYWRNYRRRRPGYTERNRQQQYIRKHRCLDAAELIAKTDASTVKKIVLPGSYEIIPVRDREIANTDVSTLEIHVVLPSYGHVTRDCKEGLVGFVRPELVERSP